MSGDTVVIDSSAVVAVFKKERDADALIERLQSFRTKVMSATNFLEAAIVCELWGKPASPRLFDTLVEALGIEIVPASAAQMEIARHAHRRFGKGRGAKASLNFGDCFAYALAKELDAPLLFKGDDFANTDIAPA
jgi:ribonuclease VapC